MSHIMPTAVRIYMAATNGADLDSLDTCLTPDAVISDVGENNKIIGVASIKASVQNSKEKFKLHAEIKTVESDEEKTKITTLTSGDFPTSPQYFHYEFTLEEDRIKRIDILPGDANVK